MMDGDANGEAFERLERRRLRPRLLGRRLQLQRLLGDDENLKFK
jgi:hypothetical protein